MHSVSTGNGVKHLIAFSPANHAWLVWTEMHKQQFELRIFNDRADATAEFRSRIGRGK
jgi:hypothetical protein